MTRKIRTAIVASLAVSAAVSAMSPPAEAAVKAEDVTRAIRDGVRFLKSKQKGDGSWTDEDNDHRTGTTSLITLALITAGEPVNSPTIDSALNFLQNFGPEDLRSTYAVSLQTLVFAAADPDRLRFQLKIANNVTWLERTQLQPGDSVFQFSGSWSYGNGRRSAGDNSNTQYALLALNAASEVGIPVSREVWQRARSYWEHGQLFDGSWAYHPGQNQTPTGSMTCAAISSLVITGLKRYAGQEVLVGESVKDCGKGGININLQRAVDWMGTNFRVGENPGAGTLWRYYYLYGLERAGRLSGLRFFGGHDWYREGAEQLVAEQDRLTGFWRGQGHESDPVIATSFALLFLAKGRAPVLINKLRHGPGGDWNNDNDDIRNIVGVVSADWKHLLTWQVVEPNTATVEDMLQAPIVYFNGHRAPVFSEQGVKNLKSYVEQGGFIFAEACCGEDDFDAGFKALMRRVFPESEGYELKPLNPEHAVWRAKHLLTPDVHPLWGIERGCRTVVIYSPGDLSCYFNQIENQPAHPLVLKAKRVGQNIIDYATGRELPEDKLVERKVNDFGKDRPKRGALRIAKLRHSGEWNIAPLAMPNLTSELRKPPLNYDVVISHYELTPRDPNIINYPLIYMHGRAAVAFADDEMAALRRHLEPGAGTIFADAACGSPAFDASFRKFVKELLPDNPLVPIPKDDDLLSKKTAIDLSAVEYTKAAGGGRDAPQLEGVKINGHWAIIYSKYDLGCALERHSGLDCKGYTYESALRIAANIVIYATMP